MREAWNQMFDVNVTGAHILTHTFAPLLLKSTNPRLLFLTSGLAQIETLNKSYYPGPPPKAGWPKQDILSPDGYTTSKVALNMMMLTWHWTLKGDGAKVWSISPGWLATNLGGCQEKLKALGAKDPALGGILIKQVIEGERDADVGKVIAPEAIQPF
jgi:NAD(P)-dependent dehydrogenase (short-subunit alcohol dehydrogenase family)